MKALYWHTCKYTDPTKDTHVRRLSTREHVERRSSCLLPASTNNLTFKFKDSSPWCLLHAGVSSVEQTNTVTQLQCFLFELLFYPWGIKSSLIFRSPGRITEQSVPFETESAVISVFAHISAHFSAICSLRYNLPKQNTNMMCTFLLLFICKWHFHSKLSLEIWSPKILRAKERKECVGPAHKLLACLFESTAYLLDCMCL